MALTISNKQFRTEGARRGVTLDVAFDSSYPTGGESLSLADLGFVATVDQLQAENKDGYRFEYDESNKTLIVHDKPYVETSLTLTDADGAAAAGVLVYVHIDEVSEQGSARAHLEFVSPTNADGTGTAYSGGPTYYIQDDDDAATGGVALYFDEDATIGSRLLANTGRDCLVDIGNGRVIKVTHNATPATPGVAIYFDEDAAATHGRLQFVSPTNVSGSETTQTEVANATDLSGLTGVRIDATGV